MEEASIKCSIEDGASWEPTIQLLRYEDGEESLRFCVYDGTRFTRLHPLLSKAELHALKSQVAKNPGITKLLKELVP